jgi:hypothetical protein
MNRSAVRLRFLIGMLALPVLAGSLLVCLRSLQAGDAKPSPTADQEQAEALIRDVFKEDYARAKTDRAARKELAGTLLKQARQIREDAVVRHVALREARDLAARAGDTATAFAAVAELARDQTFDVLAMKAKVLADAVAALPGSGDGETQAAATSLAKVTLSLSRSAADAEDFDRAVALGELAAQAAARGKSTVLLAAIEKRNRELGALQKETSRVRPFLAKLKDRPADPRANSEVGRYWALFRGNWSRGLPYLTRGGEAALRKVAAQDLAQPREANDQVAVAEGWQALARTENGSARLQMLARAYQWYRQAAVQMQGPGRRQVEGKLATLRQLLPQALRVIEIAVELRRLEGHTAEVLGCALDASGRHALSASADRTVRVWDTATGQELRRFEGHNGAVLGVAFSPDGRLAASCGEDRVIRLWDVNTGKEQRRLEGHTEIVNNVAFSPDGRLLASASDDHSVRLWDVATGKEVKRLLGHPQGVYCVVFGPDGKWLASGGSDQTVRLWTTAGKEIRQLQGHTGQILAVAFAPGGRHLLSSGEDQSIRLWDTTSGKEMRRYEGHTAPVGGLAFAPDGLRFLSCSDDQTIRVWELTTGKELRQLKGHTAAVYRVAVSQDGRLALSCSLDRTLRVWGPAR